jgi:hypothetical protein
MLLLKPLYGLKESGSYWHDTYTAAFKEGLNMLTVFLDPCFVARHHNESLDGAAALLVDDTLMTGTNDFAEAEEDMHKQFEMGPTQYLSNTCSVKFGGVVLSLATGVLEISQKEYIGRLQTLDTSDPAMSALRCGRGNPAWV